MVPLRGAGEVREERDGDPETGPALRLFTWEEIGQRNGQGPAPQERWLVIQRKVYDVSQFYRRHPGGARLIASHAGQDATEAFLAFHVDKVLVNKYLKPLEIGELAPDQPSVEPTKNKRLVEDFQELCATVEKMGLLKPNQLFFFLLLAHILLLDTAAWLILFYFGTSIMPFMVSLVVLTTSRVQASWLQHDLGHHSVFRKTKWNHLLHKFVMCHFLGASAKWWTLLHSQHHAKPNCFHKDPDIDMHPFLFTLGKKLSVELGIKKKKYMPYNHQHKYFFITLPPLLFPTYFNIHTFYIAYTKRYWGDLAWMLTFYIKFCVIYGSLLEIKSLLAYYFLVRMLESSWFVWVSQMNHIPMDIYYDKNLDWVSTQDLVLPWSFTMVHVNQSTYLCWSIKLKEDYDPWLEVAQLQATCNVEQSLFNDWFTGHLNFQIEHHLFPRMPRHNYWKVAPLVKSLCAKHGIEYQCKPLLTAFADIVHSLKSSGELWLDAYLHK